MSLDKTTKKISIREIFALLAVLGGLSFFLYLHVKDKEAASTPGFDWNSYVEVKRYELIAKFVVANPESTSFATSVLSQAIASDKSHATLSSSEVTIRQAITLYLLNNPEAGREKLVALASGPEPQIRSLAAATIQALLKDPLADYQKELLAEKLSWFGEIILPQESKEYIAAKKNAEAFSVKLKVIAVILATLVIVAFCSFIMYSILFFKKRIKSNLNLSTIKPANSLEIFAIYLIALGILPSIITYFLPELNHLMILISLMITLCILLPLWPLIFGERLTEVLKSLGLYCTGIFSGLKDTLVGFSAYLGMWCVLLPTLIIYAAILQSMGVDLASGAHPAFSWLTSGDAYTPYFILILGAVLAPILEEITFRGALYGWLRLRLSAFYAIPISAFIFASIHPQGIVGLLPLFLLGMLLAALREWRGSLLASIVTHCCINGVSLGVFWVLFS